MRIGIIDDERPARSELRYQLEEMDSELEIVEGNSGTEAIRLATEESLDLLFLDINLGDMNSTALVPALQKLQPEMIICFVTAYSDYAVQAFNLEVDDYVMKPFEPERIERVVRKCCKRNSGDENMTELIEQGEEAQPRRISVICADRTVYINTEDVVYIETYNRGCRVYTNKQVLETHQSIGQYEKKLPDFFRIYKSYLVNVERIQEQFLWSKNSVALRMEGYPDNVIPVSRDKVKELRERLEC